MRVGASLDFKYASPEEWLKDIRTLGVSTIVSPINAETEETEKKEYIKLIRENKFVVGEVGVWNNILDTDPQRKKAAVDYNKRQLALAEELGARCCVNTAGAKGAYWAGCYPENYSDETYLEIVATVREIIDEVNPKKTYYTLETMPWIFPDSPDSYLKLLQDINREAFSVHLDYANMINGVHRYLNSNEFIEECFSKLLPHIRSVHVKDIFLDENIIPCNIKEVMFGQGGIDLPFVLRQIKQMDDDMTVFVEHYPVLDDFKSALDVIRDIAKADDMEVK